MLGSSRDLCIDEQGGETTIQLLPWTRSPRMNYSRIVSEAMMVTMRPPVVIPPSDRVPEQGCRTPRKGFRDDGGSGSVSWKISPSLRVLGQGALNRRRGDARGRTR